MATKQDIEKLSLILANYMESKRTLDWEIWIKEFLRTPLVALEYAKVRENAKKIVESRKSPVMNELK